MTAQLEAGLVRLLELKRQMLSGLLSAFQSGAEHLKKGDVPAFDAEMDKIAGLPEALSDLEKAESKLRAGCFVRGGRAAELERDIALVAKQIQIAYEDCKSAAQGQLEEYGQRIKNLRNAQKGIRGYGAQRQAEAVFFDQRK